jgi:hypothetical protein
MPEATELPPQSSRLNIDINAENAEPNANAQMLEKKKSSPMSAGRMPDHWAWQQDAARMTQAAQS